MSLPLDGERLIPDAQKGSRDYRDHLTRYTLASSLVGRRSPTSGAPLQVVLDIACGEGYGSAMLHNAGGDVWGADISPRVVEYAKDRYGSMPENHSRCAAPAFFVADVVDLPWGWNDRFDLIACFETIEHVADWERALASLGRVRAPGGFLVISTPNRGVYGAGNPYHVREETTDEFMGLLEARFPSVQLLRQVEMPTSLLVEDASAGSVQRGWIVLEDQLPPEMYAVAVCGDEPIKLPAVAMA